LNPQPTWPLGTVLRNVTDTAGVKQVRAIAVAAAGWDPAALGTEMSDPDIGSILGDVETGQRPTWPLGAVVRHVTGAAKSGNTTMPTTLSIGVYALPQTRDACALIDAARTSFFLISSCISVT
jgi:hypothetical protein